jgi:NTE family protein
MSANPVKPARALIRGVRGCCGRTRRPRTAFVLSGGASLGALQVGMLRALYERGIVPDLLVGASAGAFNAAFVASRAQTVATADELAAIWCGLRREDVFPVGLRVLVAGLTSRDDHLVPDHGLRQLAHQHLQIDRIEQAVVPLHLVTFDLTKGEEVLLSSGPLIDAVLAAVAIPGLLPSVRWGERRLVDGGVVNNAPISHAVELGAERVYVLPTDDGSRALPMPPRGALDAAIHAITLLINSQLRADIARYSSRVELIVLPAPNPRHVLPTSFQHSRSLIDDALAATRSFFATAADAEPVKALDGSSAPPAEEGSAR